MKRAPLLCLFAHPDDEAFGPSGTIAKFAKEKDVYIICATSGDADAAYSKDPTKDMGVIRPKELKKSATILGAKGVEFLGFQDGCLCNNMYHKLADAITKKLETYRPDTVMTFDLLGISGHLDHIAVSLATTYACKKTDYVKKIMYFCERKEVIDTYDDYFIYMPPGCTKDQVDLVVNTEKYWDLKRKAMDAHYSQKSDADRIAKTKSRFPKEEFFKILELK